MKNYPYNIELLRHLNELRDDFIAGARLYIKKHSEIDINEVKLYIGNAFIAEDDIEIKGDVIDIEHNKFLLARVLIGNEPL